MTKDNKTDPSPELSVIVRARNEASNILLTLESLQNQTYGNFEVIVVDNNSDDKTASIALHFIRNAGFSGRLIKEGRIGRGKALHAGVLAARNEWIASLDADSVAAPDWLEVIARFIQDNTGYIAGSGQIFFKDGPLHHKMLYKWSKNIVYAWTSRRNRGWISLANSWFKKTTFLTVGGTGHYPSNIIADDRVLSLSLRRSGRIAYLKTAKVMTSNWLIEKPYWITNIPQELDQVRDVAGITYESLVHRTVKPLSRACTIWDGLKKKRIQ